MKVLICLIVMIEVIKLLYLIKKELKMSKVIISEFKCDLCGKETNILGPTKSRSSIPDSWECVTISFRDLNYLCSKDCLGNYLIKEGNRCILEINQNYRLSFVPIDRRIKALVLAARNAFDGPIPGYDETDLGEALKMFDGQFMDKE